MKLSPMKQARRAARKLAGGARHRREANTSRGAAKDSSPRREPWVCSQSDQAPDGATERATSSAAPAGARSPKHLDPRLTPWANFFRASGASALFDVGCSLLDVRCSLRRSLAAFTLLLAFALSSPADTLLLRGATIHTVSGAALSPGDVLVKDGKIAAVAASITEKADRTNNLTGLHLFPGLISPATDLGLVEIPSVRASNDRREVGDFNPNVESWTAVHPDSELIPVARANGITHFIPVPEGSILSGVSSVMATRGWTVEDMAVLKRAAYNLDWPVMSLAVGGGRGGGGGKSLDDQTKARREKVKEIDVWFSDLEAYAKGRSNGAPVVPAFEAGLPLLRGELPLVIGADDLREIKSALAWAEKRKVRIVISGGRDAVLVADQLAKAKVPVIFNHVFTLPAREGDGYAGHFSAPGLLHKAGVTVALTDSLARFSSNNARNLPYAAAQAMAFGLPREFALKAITLVPAQIYGVADKLGSIEVGKDASLVAVTGDILDARAQVKRVWIGGVEQSSENRNTRLRDKYEARPRP